MNAASKTIDQHSFVANSAGTAKSKYIKGSVTPEDMFSGVVVSSLEISPTYILHPFFGRLRRNVNIFKQFVGDDPRGVNGSGHAVRLHLVIIFTNVSKIYIRKI